MLGTFMKNLRGEENRRLKLRNKIIWKGYYLRIPNYKGDGDKEFGGDLF